MINKLDEKFIAYLNTIVNNIFKILPLYEEENVGLVKYVESLLLEFYALQEVIEVRDYPEYISLLATIEAIKKEIQLEDSKKIIVKREVFKSINIVKNLIGKIQEGE